VAGLVEHEVVEVDGSPPQPQGVLVSLGQQQQVLNEPLDTQVLGEDRGRQLRGAGAIWVGEGNFGVLADRGDR
jgi:hypothetical protein